MRALKTSFFDPILSANLRLYVLMRSAPRAQAATNAALAQLPTGHLAIDRNSAAGQRRKRGLFGPPRPGAQSVRLSQLKGRSLWIFAPAAESTVRRFLFQIVDDKRFEAATMTMILVSSLSMAIESPRTMTIPAIVQTLYAIDVASTTFFAAELVMKARPACPVDSWILNDQKEILAWLDMGPRSWLRSV
jgi:hypothetical protein